MTLRVFVIAGEASGDFLAARLLTALAELRGEALVLDGVGGPELKELGLESRFAMDELSLVGITEVLPHLPRVLRRLAQTTAAIRTTRPDLVLSVDSPSFSLRVQARVAARGATKGAAMEAAPGAAPGSARGAARVHYVAPQAWAWRPGRAKKLAHIVDRVLYVLPFEEAFFRSYGVRGEHVGHPLVERVPPLPAFLDRRRPAERPVLCLLPGSRNSELDRHLPVFRRVCAELRASHPGLSCVLATLPHLADRVRAATQEWPVPLVVDPEPRARFDHYAAADLALAASGTVGLELALARLPTVVVYRTSWLTAAIVRRLVRVRFASLINLVADREIVPEFIQDACTPERVAAALKRLLDDPAVWRLQIEGLDAVARDLGVGAMAPSRRAALAVEAVLQERAAGTKKEGPHVRADPAVELCK